MQQRLTTLGVTGRARPPARRRRERSGALCRLHEGRRRPRTRDDAREEGVEEVKALARARLRSRRARRDSRRRRGRDAARRDLPTRAARALRALDDAVVRDACPRSLRVRTARRRPRATTWRTRRRASGWRRGRARLAALYAARRPQVQFVVSDGLNADARQRAAARAAAAAAAGAGGGGLSRRRDRRGRPQRPRARRL